MSMSQQEIDKESTRKDGVESSTRPKVKRKKASQATVAKPWPAESRTAAELENSAKTKAPARPKTITKSTGTKTVAKSRSSAKPEAATQAKDKVASRRKGRLRAKVKQVQSDSGQANRMPHPPPSEQYMSAPQSTWFRSKLIEIRESYQQGSVRTAHDLREREKSLADEIDRANSEFGYVVELRENERLGNLQHKIDLALRLIESGQYGLCSECGDEIGIERLTARPVATLCIDCKQYSERLEKQGSR